MVSDMYAVPKEDLDEIAGMIMEKRGITTPLLVSDMALQISLIDAAQLPGRRVEITGACEIYVGDLGTQGFAVRIDNDFTTDVRPCMIKWGTSGTDGDDSNTIALWRRNLPIGSTRYAPVFSYSAASQTFTWSGVPGSDGSFDLRGIWQFIPII